MKTTIYLIIAAFIFGYFMLFLKAVSLFNQHQNQLKKFRAGLLNGSEVTINNGQSINTGVIVRTNGKSVTVLFRDGSSGGYGMNCIYPLISHRNEFDRTTEIVE